MSTLDVWRVASSICQNGGLCVGSPSPGLTPYRIDMTVNASAFDSLFFSLVSAPDFFGGGSWLLDDGVGAGVEGVIGVPGVPGVLGSTGMWRDIRAGGLGPAPERSAD